ncbi:glycosyltransferase [Shewanella intestini]|uniref:Glycosyltransferase family 4 protein n=1 Tax=Shewanella intestini TaxID=2017544 RepID=A0ABS5I0X1_9GAMM|nr:MULTISPECIES: glycosyltransferase [Shewanella]MBR9727566.1 glycosyltransferase family 4 protein [Shewanella intestini]MRG35284.1 glycosyltransferase [Shewanella sp. XMDDZSB0408]
MPVPRLTSQAKSTQATQDNIHRKPLVVHCVPDNNMGGINVALTHLCASSLANDVDMRMVCLPMQLNSRLNLNADIICFHGAASWLALLGMAKLKLAHPNAKFILQEHHYSPAFVREQIVHPWRFLTLLKCTYALVDNVIAISASQQAWMLSKQLLSVEKVFMLGQGRDLSRFFERPVTMVNTFVDADIDAEIDKKCASTPSSVVALPSGLAADVKPERAPMFESGTIDLTIASAKPVNETTPPCETANNGQHRQNTANHHRPIQLLAYGRFHRQKGFDVLLKAMQLVPASLCQLTLVGQGEEAAHLEQIAITMKHVQILPAVADIKPMLITADAVVVPSRWEPFGLIMQEALAMNKPVITSGVDGLGDQLINAPVKCHQFAVLTAQDIAATIIGFCQNELIDNVDNMPNRAVNSNEHHNTSPRVDTTQQLWAQQQWQQVVQQWQQLLTTLLR